MCDSSVRGPTIQVMVPSVCCPHSRSMRVPSAASSTGGAGGEPGTLSSRVDLEVLAREVDGLAPQERHQHRQILLHVLDRAFERKTPVVLDDRLVRQPQAQGKTTADRRLRGQRLLGHQQRMSRVDRDDGCPELDVGRVSTRERKRDERVFAPDVRHPDRRKPLACAGRDLLDQCVQARRVSARQVRDDPNSHAASCLSLRGASRVSSARGLGDSNPPPTMPTVSMADVVPAYLY